MGHHSFAFFPGPRFVCLGCYQRTSDKLEIYDLKVCRRGFPLSSSVNAINTLAWTCPGSQDTLHVSSAAAAADADAASQSPWSCLGHLDKSLGLRSPDSGPFECLSLPAYKLSTEYAFHMPLSALFASNQINLVVFVNGNGSTSDLGLGDFQVHWKTELFLFCIIEK